MNVKTLAWILGGALLASASVGVVACSSNNEEDPPSTKDGGTSDAGTKDATVTKDGSPVDPGKDGEVPVVDAGADVNCGRAPTFRTSPDGGVFCPFRGDASPTAYCGLGEQCCSYPQGVITNYCSAQATACQDAGGVAPFQCTEDLDCPANNKCCFTGEVVTDPGNNVACNFARGAKGTTCRPAAQPCNAGEYKVCNSPTAGEDAGGCPSGFVCTLFSSRAIDLGACLPATP